VQLVVENKGPDTHELLVARTSAPLPLRADGITVDEEALEPVTVDEVEGEARGHVFVAQFKLRPGRYELFCNMAGHYLGGMRAPPGGELTVRSGPAFRPFASRGRRAVAAILVTFALFLGGQRRAVDLGDLPLAIQGVGARGRRAPADALGAVPEGSPARPRRRAGRPSVRRLAARSERTERCSTAGRPRR
jgi:hypothetical protein